MSSPEGGGKSFLLGGEEMAFMGICRSEQAVYANTSSDRTWVHMRLSAAFSCVRVYYHIYHAFADTHAHGHPTHFSFSRLSPKQSAHSQHRTRTTPRAWTVPPAAAPPHSISAPHARWRVWMIPLWWPDRRSPTRAG